MAEFTEQQRKELAKSGAAMEDGSFPIRNRADLENAISAYGRASNKAATKRHILRRAKALNLEKLIPEAWETGTDKDNDADDTPSKVMNKAIRDRMGR